MSSRHRNHGAPCEVARDNIPWQNVSKFLYFTVDIICMLSYIHTGMIHSGIGERQLNNFLSTINLNCVDKKTLKRHENEVGQAIESMTEDSINKALDQEYELTTR